MKRIKLFPYLLDKLTGTFTGFVVALWAAKLVSKFFETRGLKNLWGLTARKTLVSKQIYNVLEWISTVFVGYLVFEIVLRLIKNYLTPYLLTLKFRSFRWIVKNGWHLKFRKLEKAVV